jgi:protein-S-isoprenylcysteine O-methyltransferase Ste14
MRLAGALRDPWVIGQFAWFGVVLGLTPRLAALLPGRTGGWGPAAGAVLLGLGLACLVRGAADLGPNLTPATEPVPDAKLVTRGIYELVRHPIYLGVSLMLAAVPLLARNALLGGIVLALSIAYFEGKARTEERKLRVRFPRYREYAAQVPRIVPFGWR